MAEEHCLKSLTICIKLCKIYKHKHVKCSVLVNVWICRKFPPIMHLDGLFFTIFLRSSIRSLDSPCLLKDPSVCRSLCSIGRYILVALNSWDVEFISFE